MSKCGNICAVHFILRSSGVLPVDIYEVFPVPIGRISETVKLLPRVKALYVLRTYTLYESILIIQDKLYFLIVVKEILL